MKVTGIEPNSLLAVDVIRNNTLFDFDAKSLFAIDLNPQTPEAKRIKWSLPAGSGKQFRPMFSDDEHLWFGRDDNVCLELDPATGQVLNEYPLLWEPRNVLLRDHTAYVFTPGGMVYALRLHSPNVASATR